MVDKGESNILLVDVDFWLIIVQISHCSFPHYGSLAIQAGAHVHSGRSRCCPGSVSYTEHWSLNQDALQGIPIHRCVSKGRHVPKRQPYLQDEIQRRNQCGSSFDSSRLEVICSWYSLMLELGVGCIYHSLLFGWALWDRSALCGTFLAKFWRRCFFRDDVYGSG